MALKLVYYYVIIMAVLIAAFGVGYLFHLLLKSSGKKESTTFFSVFRNVVIGLVIIVSVYSIITTAGKTVSWIYLLLLSGYGYFFKRDLSSDNAAVLTGNYIKYGLGLFLISVLFYFIYLSSLLDFNTLRFTDTFCDWQYYSKTSQYLNLGFESTGQFDNIAFGATFTPYHYFEIWIAAFVSFFFKIPSQLATSIIVPTVLGCICFVGILGFSEKMSFRNGVLVMLLMFLSSVSFFSSFLKRIGISLTIIAGDTSSVVSSFKLYSFLVFFVFSLHYLIQKNFRLSLICLLFIPVASFVGAPTILPFVSVAIISLIISNKRQALDFKLLGYFASYVSAFLCYYLFFWDKLSSGNFIFIQDILTRLRSIYNPAFMIFCILPFLGFLLYYRKYILIDYSTKKIILISYLILLLNAIGVVVLTNGYYDGIQFFINVFTPLTTALISLFVMRLKPADKLFFRISYPFFLFLLISSVFYSVKFMSFQSRKEKQDSTFITNIMCEIGMADSKPVFCGFIHSKTYYSGNYLRALSKVTMVGEALDSYRNNFLQVGLSDYSALDWLKNECTEDSNTRRAILSRIPEGTFYKYVELQKKNHNFVSVEQSQVSFIKQHDISYIFVQNDAFISSELAGVLKLVAKENNTTGYAFYRIVKNKL